MNKEKTSLLNILAMFDYMVIALAICYVDNKPNADKTRSNRVKLTEFNSSNDFGKMKVNLFPFLLTIANGYKSVMLDFLNRRFKPDNYGIVHKDIHNYLESSFNTSEQYPTHGLFLINDIETTINLSIFENGSSINKEEILRKISDIAMNRQRSCIINPMLYDNSYYSKDSILFQDTVELQLKSGGKKSFPMNPVVYDLADYCIEHLHKVRLPLFANQSANLLSDWSMSNSAYTLYKHIQNEDDFFKLRLSEVTFNKTIELEPYDSI